MPITAAQLTFCQQMIAMNQGLARLKNIPCLLYTGAPIGDTVKAAAASDSIRRNYNAFVRSQAANNFSVLDIASILEGSDDGTGQVVFNPAFVYADNAHPNDAGNAAVAVHSQAALAALLPTSYSTGAVF